MTIATEIQLLAPTALIELFALDLGKYGGPVLRWHAGTNELQGDVVWQALTYARFPVEAQGFDRRSGGTSPRPTIRAANIQGILANQARLYSDFMGCKLNRKRTFARYLDAANFAAGNAAADVNQSFPDDIFFVDRKSAENPVFIEWELAAAFDVTGVTLPRRQVIQNVCPWVYRGPECSYAGPPVATEAGVPTSILANDKCGKRLSDCRLRFPVPGTLPYGGFPGCGLIH